MPSASPTAMQAQGFSVDVQHQPAFVGPSEKSLKVEPDPVSRLHARRLSGLETCLRRRGRHEPGLDLAVTVGAHEDAFSRLGAVGLERLPAGNGDPKRLLRRVHVMEVEIEDTAVVTADGAAPAGLGDEDSLDLLMTSGDRFADAALATPALSSLARPV